ncbi:hypothetical protein ATK36_2022 [Amycolatopsis sulphurea]|uniref:Uncharacterized protein n=1 Tax=Amycolatopsis sulphurea TaxID=76022 RepID=A0A2A9F8Y9_9PSEU|nr:hypothetical protein [Amycolatopsis sulphurea]PFG47012.1 hypothetical protein ATK36_2022 [Amycolatopsis sulphurea]
MLTPNEPLRTAGLVVTPGDSADAAPMKLHTSGGCPAGADAYNAVMRGHGLPKDGVVITATTSAGMSRKQGFDVYPSETLHDFAADANTTFTGDYQVSVYCVDSFSQEHKVEFAGTIRVSAPGRYAALGDAKGPNTMSPRAELEMPPPSAPEGSAAPGTVAPGAAGTGSGDGHATSSTAPIAAGKPDQSTMDGWLQPFLFVAAIALAVAAVVLAVVMRRRRSRPE